MSSKYYLLLVSFIFIQPDCFADPISRALKALKKGKHEQVESVLNKSLQKNSINPGARYAFSLLYFDSTYINQNLDSAHIFIEQALMDEQQPDSLEGLPLEKASLTIDHLLAQKNSVDSSAFVRASVLNTVESYQYFIDGYEKAPQRDDAIAHRNQLAFDIAANENTYSSYKRFLDLYPDSKQAIEARKRYELLVFQSKTAEGKLKHYVEFLEEHPNTPYRSQAEWQIFQLGTLDDKLESYQQFSRSYPESQYVAVANNILYHRDKETFMSSGQVSDSLARINKIEGTPLIPIFEDGQYGFIDPYGTYQIAASFDSIPENYLCQLLSADVFQAFVDQQLVLMGRNQEVLWDKPFEDIEDMGRGLLKLKLGNKHWLLHKSGWTVLETSYNDIKFLGDSFLAVEKDNKWGIFSMSGRMITPIIHEDIQSEGGFILIRNKKWAVSNKRQIIETFELDGDITFKYDDWDLLSDQHLMVFSEDQEGIVNQDLLPVIPLSEHEIHELDSADWYVKTAHGTIRFYGDNLQAIPPDRYQAFLSNDHFICLLKNLKWEVWDRSTLGRLNEQTYDSVARLGTHLMILIDEKSSTLLFKNGATLKLSKKERVRLIRDAGQSMGFLQVNGAGGKRQIYDMEGQPIYHTWYYDVQPLTSELFIIEKNGLKGIVNLKGEILIKPRYQTIVADSTFLISLLHNGRFGYFNAAEGTLIRPQYESRVSYFSKGILISSKKGKKGLIDHKNKVIVDFEYDQIKQWSDSSIIALKQSEWEVLNYVTGEQEFNGITGLDWISHDANRKVVVKTRQGYGLLDNKEGMLLNPGFNDIINLGTANEPVFFTEKYIPEADYFVVIYYNQKMDVIRKQVFDSGNYDQVYCF